MSKVGVMEDDNKNTNNSTNVDEDNNTTVKYEHVDHDTKVHPDTYDVVHNGSTPSEYVHTSSKKRSVKWYLREDVWVLASGMVVILSIIAMMFVVGNARDWDADSGWTHNTSATSDDRFLPEPYEPEEGVRGRSDKDAAARWYYWKVKTDELTFWTHFFPWICYLLHQLLIWASIYHAQMVKAYEPLGNGRYSSKMSSFNWVSFGLNIFFHLVHFINTHSTYDGLAQDVSISTSQGSVIMLLVLALVLEYRDRGLFFGWPTLQSTSTVSKKLRLNYGPVNLIRKYHGYAFSWAAIYTFWYHPMENTWGHAMGFFYTWIIMLQGSLMYTDIHLNKYWTVFVEAFVVCHGGVIAYQTGGPSLEGTALWPMFVFGFLLAFAITQVYGLTFWKYLPKWTRIIPLILYIAVTVGGYSQIPDKDGNYYTRIAEIVRIPSIYYLDFILIWAVLYGFLAIEKKFKMQPSSVVSSPIKQTLYVIGAVSVYAVHIALGLIFEYADVQVPLTVLMIFFTCFYSLGAIVSFMCLKQVIPNRVKEASDDKDHIKGEDNLGADVLDHTEL